MKLTLAAAFAFVLGLATIASTAHTRPSQVVRGMPIPLCDPSASDCPVGGN